MEHGEHRRQPRRPPEADGEIGELHQQGDAERDQGPVAQLGAEGGADELVSDQGQVAAQGRHRLLHPVLLLGGELLGPDHHRALARLLDQGAGESRSGQVGPQLLQVDRPARLVLHQPPAQELEAEIGAPQRQTRRRQQDQGGGNHQPAPVTLEEVDASRGEPLLEPAAGGHAHEPGTAVEPAPLAEHLQEHAGHDQRREHRHHHTDGEGDTEAAHRPRGEEEQQDGGEQGGHVGVGDGAPGPLEPQLDGGGDRGPGVVLLLGAFVDEHVGVHGHPDGEDEPGDPGKGQGGAQGGEGGVGQEAVDAEGDGGHHPHQAVEGDHVEDGQAGPQQGRLDAGGDGGLSQRGTDGPLLDHLHRHGEGPGPDQQGQVGGLLLGEAAGDDGAPTGDADVAGDAGRHPGAGDHRLVEDDGHPALGRTDGSACRFGGHPGPGVGALALELDRDHPLGGALGVEDPRGSPHLVPGDRRRSQGKLLARIARQHQGGAGVVGDGAGRVGLEDRVEGELGGAADHLQGRVGIGQPGEFDDDAPVP